MFVCTHILTIWTQVFYLNQTMGQQWPRRPFLMSVDDFENHKLFVTGEVVIQTLHLSPQ